MNDARAPTNEKIRQQVLDKYYNGIKPKELSEKMGISINTIKSWIKRDKTKDNVVVQETPKKRVGASYKRSRGAPLGNKNAAGAGAPEGNKNAEKHGAYAAIYWDVLEPEEMELIQGIPMNDEMLLIEQIQLFAVREHRIMKAINKYIATKDGQYVSGTTNILDNRKSKQPEVEKEDKDAVKKKDEKENGFLGEHYCIQTSTGATIDLVSRLERELTSVQSKKTKAIESLIKLRQENRKMDDAGKGSELVDDWISSVMEDVTEWENGDGE